MNTSTIHETARQDVVVWRGMADKARHHFATRQTEGPLDLAEVRDGLFGWDVIESARVAATFLTPDGVSEQVLDRKALGRSDTMHVIGEHSPGYAVHQPREWLLDATANILDDDLVLAGAGHFRFGAVQWVQAELPDTVVTRHGVGFRPTLTAATSHDGSCATTYTLAATVIVCSNTFAAALSENPNQRVRVRHTANSVARLADVKGALNIVHEMSREFEREIDALVEQDFTTRQFEALVRSLVGDPATLEGRSATMARNKRDSLLTLWSEDPMVVDHKGTKWAAVQAFSTYRHHFQTVRGTDRVARNAGRMVLGGNDADDAAVLRRIGFVSA